MPLPTPNKNDRNAKDFINRCMRDKNSQEFDTKQRLAVCYSQWRKNRSSIADHIEISELEENYIWNDKTQQLENK